MLHSGRARGTPVRTGVLDERARPHPSSGRSAVAAYEPTGFRPHAGARG
ncbi:hypothetical protein [Streptomyces litmocidini]|nr:hypothetical protein [Streptomyces litmocidini]